MQSDRLRSVCNILYMSVCVAVCAMVSGVFMFRAIGLCMYPYPLENGEGICVHMVQLLKQGNLYKPLSTLPLIVANYPPVYFFLNWIILPSNVFLFGRCISMLATLGTGAVLFLIARRYTRRYSAGFIAASIFFMYPWLNRSGMLYRVDMLAAFFSILGFYIFFSGMRRAHLIAAVFFLLGLYTKHTVWAGPLAAYTCLIIDNRKQGIREFLIFLSAGVGIFLIATLITRGWFFRHLVLYNVYKYVFHQLWFFLKSFFKDTGIIWIPLVIGVVACYARHRQIVLYGVFSLLFLGSLGREGASAHYFFEAAISVALIASVGIYTLTGKYTGALKVLIVVLLLGIHLFMNRGIFIKYKLDEKHKQVMAILRDEIVREKGKILAEDNGMIVMADKTVYVHTFAISKLIEQGIMPPDMFYSMIANRDFSLIVLNASLEKLPPVTLSRFTKESLILINQNYKFEKQIDRSYLYRRKPR